MYDAGDTGSEGLPILDHATQRHTRHVDAVVGPFARYESLALSFTTRIVVGIGNFHSRIDRFRTRIDEENMIQASWCHL